MLRGHVERTAMGVRIRELRQERGLRLHELATRVGISSSHLSRLERGFAAPSFSVGAAIARELGVTASELATTERQQRSMNHHLVTALTQMGMRPDLAAEIQRAISTKARRELLQALVGKAAT